MDLANVPDWWVGQPRGAFSEPQQFQRHHEWVTQIRKRYSEAFRYCSSQEVIAIRELLRKVWTASDRNKEWFVFLLRRLHAEIMRRVQALQTNAGEQLVREWLGKKSLLDITLAKPEKAAAALSLFVGGEQLHQALNDSPPPAGFFEDCAFYLHRRLDKVRVCRNKKCEVRPYFIAEKKNQKFCSDVCVVNARLASKRKSWHKHKNSWNKK
jgi:hypothetical protein